MTNTLRIERLRSTYLLPRDHPAPNVLRAEMDDLARKYVPESCGRALGALLDPNDPSVWVINGLEVDLLVDVHVALPDDIAAFWASRIAASVATTISRGEDGLRVLRFANRAAYLAHLLGELAAGCAWTRWYFAAFDSLRSLPAGAAVREALLREPSQAEAALTLLLATNRLAPVCEVLSPGDQERIIACCAGDATDSDAALDAVLHWIERKPSSHQFLPLETYLGIRRDLSNLSRSHAAGAVEHVSRICRWAQDNKLHTIVSLILTGSLPVSLVVPEEVSTISLLCDIAKQNPCRLETLSGALQSHATENKRLHEFDSPLGSIFLLLPALTKTSELMELFGGLENGQSRYLLFLTCFAKKVPDAWRDSALRVAAGLDEPPNAAVLSRTAHCDIANSLEALALPEDIAYFNSYDGELLPDFTPDAELRKRLAVAAAVLVRAFARELLATRGSSIEYLWRNILCGDSWVALASGSITIRLKPRPLQIVLHMAGLHQSRFEVPWLNHKSISMRFEEP